MISQKIVLPGGAGLVGQNLIPELKKKGFNELVVIDKHPHNLQVLQTLHPDITCELADLAIVGSWMNHFEHARAVVILQAQIGGLDADKFLQNNVIATENILQAVQKFNVSRMIHISSSVVTSAADDLYSRSKKQQEKIIIESGFPCPILRPTLMFGWFDRKHLGWLSRFMKKVPIFPVPGNGRYMRQPLYAGDFSNIIVRCIERSDLNGTFNISGQEPIDYIDLVRAVKIASHSQALILKIPYRLFYMLLSVWALFDNNPPFTTEQLKALTTEDKFEVIDWQDIFDVQSTPLHEALHATFNHPDYSQVILEF